MMSLESLSAFESERVPEVAVQKNPLQLDAELRSDQPAATDGPARRRLPLRRTVERSVGPRVAFVVLDLTGPRSVPKYDELISGVSNAATRLRLDLQMFFLSDCDVAIEQLTRGRFDGLILHGTCPPAAQSARLHAIPTVWLMGNPRRPHWGDQVMPDNAIIGQVAARHLLGRGHRRAVYFGLRSGWSLATRCLAFRQGFEDAGGTVAVISQELGDFNRPHQNDLDAALDAFEQLYRTAADRPTGIFIAEDWLVRPIYNRLAAMGICISMGNDAPVERGDAMIEVISCNNDRPHLIGVSPQPATIDIRGEALGRYAVEHLATRLRSGNDLADRVRVMLEPQLILPAAQHA